MTNRIFLNTYLFRKVKNFNKFIDSDSTSFDYFKLNIGSDMVEFGGWLYYFSLNTTYFLSYVPKNEKLIEYARNRISINNLEIFIKMDVFFNGSEQMIPTVMKVGEINLENRKIRHLSERMEMVKYVQHQIADCERGNRQDIFINNGSFNDYWHIINSSLDAWKQHGIEWK